jgi:hypothetical protein
LRKNVILKQMYFINKLTVGVNVNKSGASRVHETATKPYTTGSRLNPTGPKKTGDQSLKNSTVSGKQ